MYRDLFFVGVFTLALAAGLADITFANFAYSQSGEAISVAITYAIGYVVEILVSVLGSVYIDRKSTTKLFGVVQTVKAAAYICIFIVALEHGLSLFVLWACVAFIDMTQHYSRLIIFAATPRIFDSSDLSNVQGRLSSLGGIADVLGPAIGGLLLGLIGTWFAIGCGVILIVAGSIALFAVFKKNSVKLVRLADSNIDNIEEPAPPAGVRSALREILTNRAWRRFLLADTFTTIFIASGVLLWVPMLRKIYSIPSGLTGIYVGVGSLGAIVAGYLIIKARAHQGWEKGMVPALLLCAGSLALVSVGYFKGLPIIAVLIFQGALAYFYRSSRVAIQLGAPANRLASWNGVVDAAGRIGGLIGLLLSALLFDVFGARPLYFILALGIFACAIFWQVIARDAAMIAVRRKGKYDVIHENS